MQSLQRLLLHRLHRHRLDVGGPRRFEQRHSVGGIGLVALHICPHVARRQEPHLEPALPQHPAPMVRTAARLHHHQTHLPVLKPALELRARQTMALNYPPLRVSHRQLENALCQIHRNGCSIHLGLLPFVML